KNKHYKPALEWAMSDHKREIDSIANIKDEPSFENTVAAMDAAGAALQRVSNVFYNLAQAHTNDTLRKLEEEMAPELAKHYDYILLHEKLFSRVKSVFDNKQSLKLTEAQSKLLQDTY